MPARGGGAVPLAIHGAELDGSADSLGASFLWHPATPQKTSTQTTIRTHPRDTPPALRGWLGGSVARANILFVGLPEPELLHLQLQTLTRDLEQARGVRDVALGLLEGA